MFNALISDMTPTKNIRKMDKIVLKNCPKNLTKAG